MNQVLSPELLDDRDKQPMCVFVEDLTPLEQAETGRCDSRVLAATIASVLPHGNYSVVKVPAYDIYVIRLPNPYDHTYNKYWLQYNYLSKRTRLIIAFRPDQADRLRATFESLKYPSESSVYKTALALLITHGEQLATIQAIIDNATRERDELLASVSMQ